jgi:tripartite-type tricarboxylate transporter receptor subunit TctC
MRFPASIFHFPYSRISRQLAALCTFSFLAGTVAPSMAQADNGYPNKPVKVVVNFAPGGPIDVIARLVAEKLQSSLKQPFYVENKAGSGGIIGGSVVAKSDADGHTILIGIDTLFTVNPFIYASMPFKPGDLKPVMVMGSSGLALAVHPSAGVNTIKELVQKGKQQSISFSSGGNGNPGHLAIEMLSMATNVQATHVPYRGNAPAVVALLSGEVQAGMLATPGLVQHFKSQRLNPLAVTGRQRSVLLPDVATTTELGFPEVDLEVYYLAMVPSKTPDAVVKTLQTAIASALAQPDVQEKLRSLDFRPLTLDGQKADELLAKTRDRYAAVIKATGMKAE